MTRGGAASGKSDVKICKRSTGWGIGTGNLMEDPAKSNLISQGLLHDETSLEFITKIWQNWGYNVGLVHTAGTGVQHR